MGLQHTFFVFLICTSEEKVPQIVSVTERLKSQQKDQTSFREKKVTLFKIILLII